MLNEPLRHADLTAVIVHQLRNRLSSVLFGVDALLVESERSGPVSAAAMRLRRGVDQLTDWLDQLVELTQVLSGVVPLRLEDVDLAEVIREAVAASEAAIRARHHDVALVGLGDPCVIVADRLAVELIIANLLSNAFKFTPPNGHVMLRLDRTDERVRFHVIDDGIGIASERLHEIFRLQRAETRGPGAARHVHAGLFLVERLARLHEGEVYARSEGDGRGTQMTVAMPIEGPARATRRLPSALVISDGTASLATLMRSRGYDVKSAQDVTSALQRPLPWDVVLVAESVAAGDAQVPERLRQAGAGTVVLVGNGRVPGVGPYDAVLADGFDEDQLHAITCLRSRAG
jgi:two-component sensor histidine kinase